MITLPLTFKKPGYVYTQYFRTDDIAAYEQKDEETGKVYGYEVFIIQKFEDRVMFGRDIPAKESVPGSEIWGTEAYTCRHKEDIVQFVHILEARLEQRRQNAFKRASYAPNLNDLQSSNTNTPLNNKTA